MTDAPKRRKTSFTLSPLVFDEFVRAVAKKHNRTHGGIMSLVIEELMQTWAEDILKEE